MLLMFGVGLHFSLADLMAVRRIAVPGAIAQIVVAVLLGAGVALLWDWTLAQALVFGLCLSVASTVVLLRALEARGELTSTQGQIAVGWLIIEDLVMVLALVLLPALAGLAANSGEQSVASAAGTGALAAIGWTLAKVTAFVALMLIFGRRLLPKALWWVARTGSQELFRLSVIAVALGVAFGAAKLFDVSFALGAFFAGMLLRESEFSHRAAEESLPLRDAFAVLFFVSVGMLFDPSVILSSPLKLLLAVLIIVIGKTLAAILIVLMFRHRLATALTVGASLAQIGEFSFILATLGISLGVLPEEARSLIVAGALISIALNPLLFSLIEPLRQRILKGSAWARAAEARTDHLSALPDSTARRYLAQHVVLVGCGRVGSALALQLREKDIPFVVVDSDRERVEALRAQGLQAVAGDAREALTLVQAHVAQAGMLIVCASDSTDVRPMLVTARTLNPGIQTIVRAPNGEEAELLRSEGADVALHPHGTLAHALLEVALAKWTTSATPPRPHP